MPSLDGHFAIVTGARSGLGRATALRLASLGARVALLARGKTDLEAVADQIAAGGGTASVLAIDLADAAAVDAAAERLISDTHPPRVLVNAAGTDVPGPRKGSRCGTGSGSSR